MALDEPNLALVLHQLGYTTQELDGRLNSRNLEDAFFYHANCPMRGDRGARLIKKSGRTPLATRG